MHTLCLFIRLRVYFHVDIWLNEQRNDTNRQMRAQAHTHTSIYTCIYNDKCVYDHYRQAALIENDVLFLQMVYARCHDKRMLTF